MLVPSWAGPRYRRTSSAPVQANVTTSLAISRDRSLLPPRPCPTLCALCAICVALASRQAASHTVAGLTNANLMQEYGHQMHVRMPS